MFKKFLLLKQNEAKIRLNNFRVINTTIKFNIENIFYLNIIFKNNGTVKILNLMKLKKNLYFIIQ